VCNCGSISTADVMSVPGLVLNSCLLQDCLRSALEYLPACYDDLTYETGCCSLRCRAAIEKVCLLGSSCAAGDLCQAFFAYPSWHCW
jgi:hypothetical protein